MNSFNGMGGSFTAVVAPSFFALPLSRTGILLDAETDLNVQGNSGRHFFIWLQHTARSQQ